MAKTSAKSKGYRKTIKKKPFLTKKEIIELVVILAVILLGVVLFNIFYDDGFIKEDKVQAGDIVSYATSDLRDRYKKIGTVNEVEGFTLEERGEDEAVISAYTFTSDDGAENIETMSVNGSFVNAQSLVDTTMAYMSGLTDDSYVTGVLDATIQGCDAKVFAYTYGEYDPEYGAAATEEVASEETSEEEAAAEETTEETAVEETPANNKFTQAVSAYIAVDDTHTLCFHIYRKGGDESFYLAEEELVDFIQPYTAAFTIAQAEE